MPSTGFYLFLPREKPSKRQSRIMCQCPQRASTYFFSRTECKITIRHYVSMPSTGFYLFLRCMRKLTICFLCGCVNALNGLLLISSPIFEITQEDDLMCQCPQRASTYFFYHGIASMPLGCIVSMPSTGFYLFLQYPPRTLDFTEFWRGFLQVINWIFCQLIFSIVFLCLCCGRNMYTHL